MKKFIVNVMCRSLAWEKREEIAACVEKGYGVIVLDKDATAYAGLPVDHFVPCDVTDVKHSTALAINYFSDRKLSIAGVVGWTDTGVHLVANLAYALGLPGTDPSRVDTVRDKVKTRKLLESVPGANPPYMHGESVEDLQRALDVIGTPCMLKYPGASGGRGIIHIDLPVADVSDLYKQFRALCDPAQDPVYNQRIQEFVVERKITGSEHSVAGLVNNGVVTIWAVVDKETDERLGYQYRNTIPSRLCSIVQSRMCTLARRAIEISEINNCGFHVDFMVENGFPYILEIGGRLGGECINSHIIPLATRCVRPYHMLIDVVTGFSGALKDDYRCEIKQAAVMLSLYGRHYGKIVSVEKLDKAAAMPGVVQLLQVRKQGDFIEPPSRKYNSLVFAHALIKGKDLSEVDSIAVAVSKTPILSTEAV